MTLLSDHIFLILPVPIEILIAYRYRNRNRNRFALLTCHYLSPQGWPCQDSGQKSPPQQLRALAQTLKHSITTLIRCVKKERILVVMNRIIVNFEPATHTPVISIGMEYSIIFLISTE
jgi:hypothetical protein